MKLAPVQRVMALLCLVAFGLGQTMFGVGVQCRDVSGGVRFEPACFKIGDGGCRATACGDKSAASVDAGSEAGDTAKPVGPAGFPAESAPCEDEPLGLHAVAFKSARPDVSHELAAAVVAAPAAPAAWLVGDRGTAGPGLRREWAGWRPPDALRRLRTIVLIV